MKEALNYILEWRKAFGLKVNGEGTKLEIELANELIFEEWKEYLEACLVDDDIEILDAVADLAFVATQKLCMYETPVLIDIFEEEIYADSISGAIEIFLMDTQEFTFSVLFYMLYSEAAAIGVNFEDLIKEVYDSNMSKLCKDIETAVKTVESYKEKGIDVYYKPSASDSSKFIIYRSSDDKVLKSVDFVEPNIKKLL